MIPTVEEWQNSFKTEFPEEVAAWLRHWKTKAQKYEAALKEIERSCPCGARPESPATHPHVIGCPVGTALHADERSKP